MKISSDKTRQQNDFISKLRNIRIKQINNVITGTVIETERSLINDRSRISKVC